MNSKSVSIFWCGLILLPSLAFASNCARVTFPSEFTMRQVNQSLGVDFQLLEKESPFTDHEALLASVIERLPHWKKTFEIQEEDGETIATAETSRLGQSWVEIKDCEGRVLGSLRRNFGQSAEATIGMFSILDPSGAEVLKPELKGRFPAVIDFIDEKGVTAARVSATAGNLPGSEWKIRIYERDKVEPLLLILAPTLITSRSFL